MLTGEVLTVSSGEGTPWTIPNLELAHVSSTSSVRIADQAVYTSEQESPAKAQSSGGAEVIPIAVSPQDPFGSLIYDARVADTISSTGETDTYTISVASGQTITLAVEGSNGLQASVELAAGKPLIVHTYTLSPGTGESAKQLDPAVRLYDAAGNLVAIDDNSARMVAT